MDDGTDDEDDRTGAAPGSSLSEPLRAAYREWIETYAAWIAAIAAADGIEVGDTRAETEARMRAVRAVAEGSAATPADFAAVLHVWWEEHGPLMRPETLPSDPDALDASDPACAFVARAWRAAAGRDGWPRVV